MLTGGSLRPSLGALPCWVRWPAAAGLTLMLLLQFLGDQCATHAGHIMELVWDLESFHAGSVLLPGPEFFDSKLRVGGPFFFLLHQPARLVGDPILGNWDHVAGPIETGIEELEVMADGSLLAKVNGDPDALMIHPPTGGK